MKKVVALLLFMILICINIFACVDESKVDNTKIDEYSYIEEDYLSWRDDISAPSAKYSEDRVSDAEAAIKIASAEFKKIQDNGICVDYVLQGVILCKEDKIWCVCFAPERPEDTLGGDYGYFISQNTGEILWAGPGE